MKQLPHNREMEQHVLGALLLAGGKNLDRIDLRPTHFHLSQHAAIFALIAELAAAGKSADMVSIAQLAHERNQLADIGGRSYLVELTEVTPTAAMLEQHAEIVSELAGRRDAIHLAEELLKAAHSGEQVANLATLAKGRLDDLQSRGRVESLTTTDLMIPHAAKMGERFDRYQAAGDWIPGHVTGITGLDRMLGGWMDGYSHVLAGRPGMGKTAALLSNVKALEAADDPALIISLEDHAEGTADRLVSAVAQIDNMALKRGQISGSNWEKITDAHIALSKWRARWEFKAKTLTQIMRVIRAGHRQGHRIVFIDYLTLIDHDFAKRGWNQTQMVGDISRRLTILAGELNMAVVNLAQLNRGLEGRKGELPRLSDLRDSGQIEQDAYSVVFIHRPGAIDMEAAKEGENPDPTETFWKVAKARNGIMGVVKSKFIGSEMRFEEVWK